MRNHHNTILFNSILSDEYVTNIVSLNYNNNDYDPQGQHQQPNDNDEMNVAFVSNEWIQSYVVPRIVATIVGLSLFYCIMLYVIVPNMLLFLQPPNGNKEMNHHTQIKKRKFAFQLTNLFINLFLGLYGLYSILYHGWTNLGSGNRMIATIPETINGFLYEYSIFGCIQLGYQVWSIIICILYVPEESSIMFVHHVAVIVTSCLPTFFRNGYRYYTPYLFGVVEISSVPLAITNSFKDQPQWIQLYPTFYNNIRLVFAGTFLLVRVLCFIPIMTSFLIDLYILFIHHTNVPYILFMSSVWICSFILLVLQLHWGKIIITGLMKHFFPKQPKPTNKMK